MTRDTKLRRHILDELEFDPFIDAAHIGVGVDDGVVSLTGRVSSFSEKRAAEAATRRVKGVRGIAEDIAVVLPEAWLRDDAELAREALCLLEWDTTMPRNRIQVAVDDGWVTLSGDIDSYFQGQAAQQTVQKLKGVKGVTNHINLRAEVMPHDVTARIRRVFERRDIHDPDGIRVTAFGGKVTLEGNVRSMHERRLAERAARGSPGVTYVDDRMVVLHTETLILAANAEKDGVICHAHISSLGL